jgi:O-antigen/teichoic acid export membrane protein
MVGPGLLLNLLGGSATAVGAFLVTVVVGRSLGVRDSATFFEAIAIFSILTVIGQAGSTRGLVWSVAGAIAGGRTEEIKPVIRTAAAGVAALSSVLMVGLFVAAPFVADHVGNGQAAGLEICLRALALFLPCACVGGMLLAATRGFHTMAPTVAIDGLFKALVRVSSIWVAVAFAARPTVAVVAWSVPVVTGLIASVVWLQTLYRRLGPVTLTPARPRVVRSFWRFSSFQVLSDFFQVNVQWLDIVLLGALGTAVDTGTYAAIGRVVFVGLLALVAITQVVSPHMSALLTTGERHRAQTLFRSATLWLCVVSFPIYLLMAAYPVVVTDIFGAGFRQGARPLVILSLAMLVNVGTGPVMAVLVMGGKSGLGMFDTAVALAANIVLNVLLIPRFGMIGAATAWAVSIAIANGLPTIQVWRLWKISPFGPGYWTVAVTAVITYGGISLGIRYAGGENVRTLALSLFVATSGYVALLSRSTLKRDLAQMWSQRSK